MKRILLALVLVVLTAAAVALARTLMLTAPVEAPEPALRFTVDADAVAKKLSALVRCRTVSAPGLREDAQFDALYQTLSESFPALYAAAKLERPGGALLFTLEGSDPSKPPLVLMAHHDVVPVEPGTESKWAHEPYSGEVADGFVWGRGTMDDKGSLVAVFEAVEASLAQGWKPKRTLMIVSGHDEESGGSGARAAAELLQSRGVKPFAVFDEGTVVLQGVIPGVEPKVAMIGVAEKGFLTLELSAKGEGGHSSMPPKQTATGVVAAAITRLEASPFPMRLDTPTGQMLETLGPYLPFGARLAVANQWLLSGVLKAKLGATPSGAASLHTTVAATVFNGSVKDNVLPQQASALVNFRILPGESIESVTARVKSVVNDPRVEVKPAASLRSEPSPVSRLEGPGYALLRRAIRQSFPEAVITPGLVMGATDARAFTPLSNQVFRFVPATFGPEDVARLHGTNERASVQALAQMVSFYRALLADAD